MMRSSVKYFLLLTFLDLKSMEKPSQTKMQISPEEFAQECNRSQSYLTLLPATGLRDIVGRYAFNSLEEIISYIREEYLNNLQTRDNFLNNEEFNAEIIAQLLKHPESNLPYDERQSTLTIAGMLNTPASFRIAARNNIMQWLEDRLLWAYRKYINNVPMSYEQLISYTREFFNNYFQVMKPFRYLSPNYSSFMDEILAYITRKITGKSLETKLFFDPIDDKFVNIKIEVALDLGLQEISYYWFREFILKDEHPEKMCALWAQLLVQAIEHNNFDQVIFLLDSIDRRFFPEGLQSGSDIYFHPFFKDCLISKMRGETGLALINYIFNNLEFIYEKSEANVSKWNMLLYFMQVLIIDAIQNPNATSERILKWIKCSYLTLNYIRDMPTQVELAYYRSGPGAGQQGGRAMYIEKDYAVATTRHNLGIALLHAVINSKRMNSEVLSEIIKRGADINAADEQGITILMHAVKNARVDFVRILLEQPNINFNACDKNGHNALWYARNLETDMATRLTIIELLQHAGATEKSLCPIQ